MTASGPDSGIRGELGGRSAAVGGTPQLAQTQGRLAGSANQGCEDPRNHWAAVPNLTSKAARNSVYCSVAGVGRA